MSADIVEELERLHAILPRVVAQDIIPRAIAEIQRLRQEIDLIEMDKDRE